MKNVLKIQTQLGISGGWKTELLRSLWVNVKTGGSAGRVNRDK